MNDKNITLPVVIKRSHKEALQALASREERSLSYFAREAFDDLLAKYGLIRGAGLGGDAQTGPEKVTSASIAQSAAVVTNGAGQ